MGLCVGGARGMGAWDGRVGCVRVRGVDELFQSNRPRGERPLLNHRSWQCFGIFA